ncbi:MAG: hypothetical protein LBF51_03420 [Zoogloeaceae bacterium]|jgi:hypothetical protein|nr:hypothetical protein [Zoogloeaceae bacterium]
MKSLFAPLGLLLSGIVLSLPSRAEPPLGRLFYTPAERAAMEAQKDNGDAPEAAAYQGLVVRGTGAITVWREGEDEARELPPQAEDANLWRNVGGARDELLRGGSIVAHPGKPAREQK